MEDLETMDVREFNEILDEGDCKSSRRRDGMQGSASEALSTRSHTRQFLHGMHIWGLWGYDCAEMQYFEMCSKLVASAFAVLSERQGYIPSIIISLSWLIITFSIADHIRISLTDIKPASEV